MRHSNLFSQTLRDAPADVQAASHQFLLRAGFIRLLSTGIYSYLPLALMAIRKIEKIIREEMGAIGAQEILMPVVHPAEIWKESGRFSQIDSEMTRLKDRNGRDLVLGMTHEEVVADLVRREIQSYKQLPSLIYQIQTKWRDDPRPRAGLIRTREFIMKDSYSLDSDWNGLDIQYQAHYRAYHRIFQRCGVAVLAVKSDTGMMGGKSAHEFMVLTPIGEDTIIICSACGYAANRQVAEIKKVVPASESTKPLLLVATPDCKTIDAVASFLQVPKENTAKAIFMIGEFQEDDVRFEKLIFALVRGDMELSETKLTNAVRALSIRPATEAEISAAGAVAGYASPIGLQNVLIIVDDLIPQSTNLVSGANQEGFHYMNLNYGRDFTASLVTDLVNARAGDPCPRCGSSLQAERAVEVGNIFKLGTRFSDTMGCTFLDKDGAQKPVIMGSYGIGLGRLLATIAEIHHDERGLIWPISVAPFPVHLLVLPGKKSSHPQETAELVYKAFASEGLAVLYDDRDLSAGIKFADADLIGLPIRLTISERSLNDGGVEVKQRTDDQRYIVPVEEIPREVNRIIHAMEAQLISDMIVVTYKE